MGFEEICPNASVSMPLAPVRPTSGVGVTPLVLSNVYSVVVVSGVVRAR